MRTRFLSTWQYSEKNICKFFNIYRISLYLIYLSSIFQTFLCGWQHCIVEGDVLTCREEDSTCCFYFLNFIRYYFIYLFILAPGGGPVPFVHPRKYAAAISTSNTLGSVTNISAVCKSSSSISCSACTFNN